jgi:SAM-dependent methyltransferase
MKDLGTSYASHAEYAATALARKLVQVLLAVIPFRIAVRGRRRRYFGESNRFEYQNRYVAFDIPAGAQVLDVGSGGDPFPHATVLVDRYLERSCHRHEELVRDGRPQVVADVADLPFEDVSFDYVYCSHLLEHVDDPIKACSELMRVGRRGFIETPNFSKDTLFAWAKGMHKWHLVGVGGNLCFFEYSPRELEGIRCNAWHNVIISRWHHPLQKAFYENQDVFNVLFPWESAFDVFVFQQDGRVQTHLPRSGSKPCGS